MPTLTQAFTSAVAGAVFGIAPGQSISYAVTGTFSATWVLEKQVGSGAWQQVATATDATGSGTFRAEVNPERLRFRCSAYTSGTITSTITDVDDTLAEWENEDGLTILAVKDNGISAKFSSLTDTAGNTPLNYVDVVVSSAEILALNATPKTLVAAPGANKILVFHGAVFFLDYNSAAYAGIAAGEDWTVKYTDASGAVVAYLETTGFLDLTADAYRLALPAGASAAVLPSVTPVANAALVLHQLTAEIITGDSPVAVRVFYSVVDLSTLVTA